jgi:hypothetical protein
MAKPLPKFENHRENLALRVWGSQLENLNLQDSGKMALAPRHWRVRCPDCFKLYSINPGEIAESRPRFECSGCSKKFWIAMTEADPHTDIMGFPLEWIERPPAEQVESTTDSAKEALAKEHALGPNFQCPKCKTSNEFAAKECKTCGVVFEKLKNRGAKSSVAAAPELKMAWEKVLSNFEDRGLHQAFVNACVVGQNLKFALSQYSRLKEVNPQDELILEFMSKVATLIEVHSMNLQAHPAKTAHRPFPIFPSFVGFCGFLMLLGFFVPQLRNLVGLGAALLFVCLAIRSYFNPLS